MAQPNRTPLYERHRALGARMIEFAGWEMPIQYPPGTVQEHLATRKGAGLFDVSYMGRFIIRGRRALEFLRGLVIAAGLSFLALLVAPTGLGPHLALPGFAAAYAWERRTVFWRYATPVLVAYVVLVPPLLYGLSVGLSYHALAGLLAWLLTRVFPYHRPFARVAGGPALTGLGLDFRDDEDLKNR